MTIKFFSFVIAFKWLIYLPFLLLSCKNNSQGNKLDTLSISIVNTYGSPINVSILVEPEGVGDKEVKKVIVERSHKQRIKLSTPSPTFATLFLGDTARYTIYLTSSQNLTANVGTGGKVHFNGSKINNFLSILDKLTGKDSLFMPPDDLDEKKFIDRYQRLEDKILSEYKIFCKREKIEGQEAQFIHKICKSYLLRYGQEFVFFYGNEKYKSINPQQDPKALNLNWPEKFSSFIDLKVYDSLIHLNFPMPYFFWWNTYIDKNFYKFAASGNENKGTGKYQTIINTTCSKECKEFFSFMIILSNYAMYSITPDTEFPYNDFKSRFKDSPFLPVIEEARARVLPLIKGRPAFDFSATTIDDKAFSLSDLKGSIVYMDVWATWCGPCIAEMPHSMKLIDRYSKNDKVKFLFISVDKDAKSWKRMVKKNKWKGLHINLTPEQGKVFSNKYKIQGTPVYILVDKDLKFIDSKAPRPSDKKIDQLISDALKEK